MDRTRVIRALNALMAIIFMGIITSAFYQEFFKHELPCPLCYLQRLGMVGVSIGALMNLRFGVRVSHYAISLLSAFFGGAVAIRQICLHICPGFPVFGYPVFGLSLYTWSFLSFASALFAVIILLFLYSSKDKAPLKENWLDYLAYFAVSVIILLNILATLWQCGIGPCQDVPWPQGYTAPDTTAIAAVYIR